MALKGYTDESARIDQACCERLGTDLRSVREGSSRAQSASVSGLRALATPTRRTSSHVRLTRTGCWGSTNGYPYTSDDLSPIPAVMHGPPLHERAPPPIGAGECRIEPEAGEPAQAVLIIGSKGEQRASCEVGPDCTLAHSQADSRSAEYGP